jgi:predicted GIY-YIG superfamily endonuclease
MYPEPLSLYDPENPNEFIIDLDKLAKWLSVRKYAILTTLRESYRKNVDFIEIPPKDKPIDPAVKKPRGGNLHITVMITPECMKLLCMRSKSAKAETVRHYFIEVERFVFNYNEEIVDGLMQKIKALADKNIANGRPDGEGLIYIIRAAANLYKLGQTKDLLKRLAVYNTGRIEDVKVIAVYETQYRKEVERCVKELVKAKQFKKRREIYEVDYEIIQKVITGCMKLSLKLHHKSRKDDPADGQYYMIFTSDIPGRTPVQTV